MTQRLEQIESKIAFLEQANAELSDEVLHQQRIIEELRKTVAALTARLDAAKSEAPSSSWSAEDERPPHY